MVIGFKSLVFLFNGIDFIFFLFRGDNFILDLLVVGSFFYFCFFLDYKVLNVYWWIDFNFVNKLIRLFISNVI